METYICIGKCVPTPASLSFPRSPSRSPSSDRTSFTRRVPPSAPPPSPALPSAYRTGPSLLSFPLVMLALVALTIPRSRFQPLSPSLASSRFLQRRAFRSSLALFFPPVTRTLFFPEHAPEPSSDFYNLLLVAPHTATGRRRCCRHRRVSGAARPEKPENRGKQKSGRRGAPRILRGWYARTWVAMAVTVVARGESAGEER